MDKKYLFPVLLFLLTLAIIFLIYKSQDLKRTYKTQVLKGLNNIEWSQNSVLAENDIKNLPEPVQKYLAYVGVIGKEKVQNMRVAFDGEMKLDPEKDWVKIKSQQYNFFDHLTRVFFIRGNMSGIPLMGLHSYSNGSAEMLIKLAGLLTVADSRGPEMDQAETVTVFNDMCLMAPATLIDKRIQWETVDPLTVKAVFNNKGNQISAVLYFDEKGALTNFSSDDRSLTTTGKSFEKLRWSTPVREYKEINGLKLPRYAEAIWHRPEGDYCYAKFTLREIEYNRKTF